MLPRLMLWRTTGGPVAVTSLTPAATGQPASEDGAQLEPTIAKLESRGFREYPRGGLTKPLRTGWRRRQRVSGSGEYEPNTQ